MTTKLPWPPIDGGRLLMSLTLEALHTCGVEIDLIAPYDPAVEDCDAAARAMAGVARLEAVPRKRRSRIESLAQACVSGEPISIAMHRQSAVARAVASSLSEGRFDVVHAEQLQAFPQCELARSRGVSVVLRCQNVESDLWRGFGGGRSRLAQIEAKRLARFEGRAVRSAAAAIALTDTDASRLSALAEAAAGASRRCVVETIAAPFPAELPPAESRLAGDPPLVLVGSAGWHVNDDGARWFLTHAWPRVSAGNPNSILHIFGKHSPARLLSGVGSRATVTDRISWHPNLDDSRSAFAPGAILIVPLRFASGVRMRILEAWARGIPVVATPAAVHGMRMTTGVEALLGNTGEELMQAVQRLHSQPEVAAALVEAGRNRLRRDHAPHDIAAALVAVYERARAGADALHR